MTQNQFPVSSLQSPVVVPTITADNPHDYHRLIGQIDFAPRIGIDFSDGEFAPHKLINIIQAYWPPDKTVDFHLMYKQPGQHLETMVSMHPSLVVLHVEAEGNLGSVFKELKAVGIKTGAAFLPATNPADYASILQMVDHVLIFAGQLGFYGGTADLKQLDKVGLIKAINPKAEISWDGGINAQNAAQIAAAGVDVLNVGGFIAQSANPQDAYATLKEIVEGVK